MPRVAERKRTPGVQEALDQVRALLQKRRIIESMVHKQDMPRHELVESLVHKQNLGAAEETRQAPPCRRRLHPRSAANARRMILKELAISLLNGLVWGGVAGLFAWWLYHGVALGAVMMNAMLLNLLVGALVGILVPMAMQRLRRDPAIGSSVLLTFTTDSMGFFIFLGLATVFLP
jgi:hypothetical protein